MCDAESENGIVSVLYRIRTIPFPYLSERYTVLEDGDLVDAGTLVVCQFA